MLGRLIFLNWFQIRGKAVRNLVGTIEVKDQTIVEKMEVRMSFPISHSDVLSFIFGSFREVFLMEYFLQMGDFMNRYVLLMIRTNILEWICIWWKDLIKEKNDF